MADSSKNNALNIHHPSTSTTAKGGWKAAIFIICVEFAERFAYQGLAGNLVTYLTNVLNQSTPTAVKNVNTWMGISTSLCPLLGGFIADSYLGRFTTILLSSLIYLLGTILLTLSVSAMKNETLFFVALYILAVGDGGHKPCVQTFAADQFDEGTAEEKEAKSSFFNWWYLGIVAGSTSAVFVVIYLQDNVGWSVGFGLLAGVLALALALFLLGIRRYRKQRPTGSPFTRMAQVFVAAARKWRLKDRSGHQNYWYGEDHDVSHPQGQPRFQTLAHTDHIRFLDKAMIIDDVDASNKTRNPWRLCSVTQVEEVKLILRLIPIWLSCLMYNVVLAQIHTFFIKQGSTMVRSIGPHFQIPPGSLLGLVGLTILFAVPIYDRVLVPLARKFTGHPSGITVLQRIGIGLFLSIISMAVSALVEAKRVSVARDHNLLDTPKAVLPMRIWWLLPQYMINGFADVFTVVGLQELFYDQMPEAMRSVGAAAYISIGGFGSFVSNVVIVIVEVITSRAGGKWLGNNLNRAHLDYFYWLLAVLSALNLGVYVWLAKGFVHKKVDGDETNNQQDSVLNKHPSGV